MTSLASSLGRALAFAAALLSASCGLRPTESRRYVAPRESTTTIFPAKGAERRLMTIEAATDVSFTRPFITDFQKIYPNVTVRYVDSISSALFARASKACREDLPAPDLYLTVSTDHLVRLANDGCASKLPARVVRNIPAWAQWRRNVVAFSLEPAVFIYNTDVIRPDQAPKDHLQLIEMLRDNTAYWRGKIGTYDIEAAGSGYIYAAFDAHQSSTYGRLIESFGRSEIKTFCCSNVMVDAVARGDILFAYNVQNSYAYAGKRAGKPIGVVLPEDYQAMQTRSVMVSRHARNRPDAVAFVQYLNSARGQAIAGALLSPLAGPSVSSTASSTRLLSPVTVGPVLLGLGDQARRTRFTREWKSAIKPATP